MKKPLLLFPLFASLFLFWCGMVTPNTDCTTGDVCILSTITGQQISLTGVAQQTIQAIKTQDFETLARLASASGVRFSPYENIKIETDIILSTQQIVNALSISAAYTRWTSDGSGFPINLWIGQYREKFVYDVDFANAPVQQRNQIIQRWNIINNITTVYTGKQVIEYHFSWFNAEYEGMDRRSLFLVFDQENGVWKLIGVVHGQWTI